MILMQLDLTVDPSIVNAVIALPLEEASLRRSFSHAEDAMSYIARHGQ